MPENKVDIQALVAKLLEHEVSPEVLEIRKIATESDIRPSRIPAPMNITQVGGYVNLLMQLNEQEMLRQTLSAILGLPMQTPKG